MESKYFSIYNDIMTKIEARELAPNEKLPSEASLMAMYNVSRDTVRKSLNLLEQNGYIIKSKGKGSFVVDINKFDFPVSGVVSFKELSKNINLQAETIVEKLNIIVGDHKVKRKLNCNSTDEVWEIYRVRKIGKERIILDKDYINRGIIQNLTEEICKDSIYQYIENQLNLKIAFAKKEITVARVTEEDKEYLDMNDYNVIVVVKSYTYLENGDLFQYTESRHRPDRFRFVDFARRKK